MKKRGMILAAGCMILAMGMTALASEEKESFEETGFSMPLADELTETSGLLLPYPLGAMDSGHHVYGLAFLYEALPKEEALEIMYSEEPSDEDSKRLEDAQNLIGMVLAGDVDFDRIQAVYEDSFGADYPLDYENAGNLASADGFTFYYLSAGNTEDYLSSIDGEYAEEYQKLGKTLSSLLKESDFYAPVDPVKEIAGKKIEFTTTDLDGNTVTSEELFSQNEITLLNCWGTWCGFCVAEMPELVEIQKKLQEKGCGFVGLEYEEVPTEETWQKARDMMQEWGTNYPNVLFPEELHKMIPGFPTTIYVDKEGNVVGVPVTGPKVEEYEAVLDSVLGDGKDTAEAAEADAVPAAVYHVTVTDEEGPVEEVTVQFCDDSTCRFAETDENGVATFEAPAGRVYDVHVLEVPDGYEEDDTVYHNENGSGEVTIQLHKEG